MNEKKLLLPGFGETTYSDEGNINKPTLLLLHGFGNSSTIWQKNIDVLKENFRCIAPDLPGHGKTFRADVPYSITYYSNFLHDFIKALNLQNIILAGHSMGGQVAIVASLRFPALVSRLILIASAGFEVFTPYEMSLILGIFRNNPGISDFLSGIKQGFLKRSEGMNTLIEKFGNENKGHSKEFMMCWERSVKGMLDEPVYDLLQQIIQPTLVIFGEKDPLIPNRFLHSQSTKQIAESGTHRIPGAILKIIPECGHFPQFEAPEAVNTFILEFIQE